MGVTNEVHETAGGLLMLAGEFRYIWKLLSTVYQVSDGLERLKTFRLKKKLKHVVRPLNTFSPRPAATGRSHSCA